MKALVTGGAGFIGSHLVEALNRHGAKVVVLDDLSAGSQRLDSLSKRRDIELIQGSVTDAALLKRVTPGCEWVFHQAAITSVPRSVEQPLETNEINLTGTLRVLQAARECGVRRFVFASSSAVYGDNGETCQREDSRINPISPYGLQKYAAEQYARLFQQLYGLGTVSLRYFNVFGPGQSYDSPYSGVIARFCMAALRGKSPTIFGDGLQVRDFVYVDTVVDANIKAAESSTAGQAFNIGSGARVSLLDLIAALSEISGREIRPQFEPARPGDVRHSEADISFAQRVLGVKPIPWRDGLRATYKWYEASQ